MEETNVESNEYTICIRNIILGLKMIGIFPFFPLEKVYNISREFSSILAAISLSIYFLVNLGEQIQLFYQLRFMLRYFNFSTFVLLIPPTLTKLLLFIGPCVIWYKTEQSENYANNWKRFQTEIEKVTRTPFKCPVKKKIQGIFVAGIICTCSQTAIVRTRKWKVARTTASTFALLYQFVLFDIVMTYWIANNMYTTSAATKITDLVQQAMRNEKQVDLRRLIESWTRLCDLKDQFNNNHSFLFLFIFCLVVINGVIGSFSIILLITFVPDNSIRFIYFYSVVVNISSLIVVCESAYSLTNNMVNQLRKVLLSENVIKKNKKLLEMILLFLETIDAGNPQFTLYGYITLNRSTIFSVFGTAIYLLLVLNEFNLHYKPKRYG